MSEKKGIYLKQRLVKRIKFPKKKKETNKSCKTCTDTNSCKHCWKRPIAKITHPITDSREEK